MAIVECEERDGALIALLPLIDKSLTQLQFARIVGQESGKPTPGVFQYALRYDPATDIGTKFKTASTKRAIHPMSARTQCELGANVIPIRSRTAGRHSEPNNLTCGYSTRIGLSS
jgi:hypothetical protein